jgi:RNA polymerase sigma-70 factor (ECF subfamily)
VVDAFYSAARDGDMEALLAVLDPEVVLRADLGPGRRETIRGAERVAANACMFATPDRTEHPLLVNGQAGALIKIDGEAASVMAFTVAEGRIVEIEILADPDRKGPWAGL